MCVDGRLVYHNLNLEALELLRVPNPKSTLLQPPLPIKLEEEERRKWSGQGGGDNDYALGFTKCVV